MITPLVPSTLPIALLMLLLILAQLISGLGSTIYFITQVSLRQTLTPTHLLGRINASNRFISRSMMPLGALAAGSLSAFLSIKFTILLFSICFISTVILLHVSKITKMKDMPDTFVFEEFS